MLHNALSICTTCISHNSHSLNMMQNLPKIMIVHYEDLLGHCEITHENDAPYETQSTIDEWITAHTVLRRSSDVTMHMHSIVSF
jgi:hypothetical protein